MPVTRRNSRLKFDLVPKPNSSMTVVTGSRISARRLPAGCDPSLRWLGALPRPQLGRATAPPSAVPPPGQGERGSRATVEHLRDIAGGALVSCRREPGVIKLVLPRLRRRTPLSLFWSPFQNLSGGLSVAHLLQTASPSPQPARRTGPVLNRLRCFASAHGAGTGFESLPERP